MKTKLNLLLSLMLIAAFVLSACGQKADDTTKKLGVGIVLPTKDEPRWIQDQTRFQDALSKAGYDVQILFSQGDSAKEKANVESLISQGIKVLIITPQDAAAAASTVEEARKAGIKVISYDRLVTNTDAVDFYVTFDSITVGKAQAQYLVDHAKAASGNPLYLYAGAATDNNAFLFFEGAWDVLQPKIADGTFVIKNSSEAVGLQSKATLTRDEESKIIGQITTNWDFNTAKNLAEANLTAAPAADKGDVSILAPNDGTARAIADAFAADKDIKSYVVTGQDAEKASVQYIIDGKQSMTVFKDVRTLVDDAINAAVTFLKGQTPTSTTTYNNGKIDVPANPTVVVTVDKDNVQSALIDSGYYQASDFTMAPAAEVAAPIEVTFWHAYGTGSAEETALTALLAQAAKDLPQYKINVLQVPFNDIYNKYRTDVAAGGGPDMFIAPNDSLGDDARAGLIADITDLAKGKLDGINQLGIDGMSLDGKLYGIPESLKAVTLWYNKDMMATPPANTDELKAAMEAGTPISLNYGCYHMYGYYSAFGGNIFDSSWKVVADQGNGVVDAFTYLNSLYQIQKKNNWAMNDSDGLAPFSEGKLAAIMNGNWAMGDYKKALGDKLGVVALPAGPAGPAKPMLGVDGFYINPNSANQAAAIDVALYLSNAASQTVMMNQAGHVPVRTDVTITDPLIQGLVDAFNKGATIRPQVPELGKYWSNFCGSDAIYEKGTSPADFVKAAVEAANK